MVLAIHKIQTNFKQVCIEEFILLQTYLYIYKITHTIGFVNKVTLCNDVNGVYISTYLINMCRYCQCLYFSFQL